MPEKLVTQPTTPIRTKTHVFRRKMGLVMLALLGLAIVCVGALQTAWVLETRREARIATELDHLGAIIDYSWRLDDGIVFMCSTARPSYWLVPGDATITRVNLSFSREKFLDEKLACLKSLRHLRCLRLGNTLITDAALPHVAGVPSLRMLDLVNTPITDDGLRHVENCPRIDWLDLGGTRVSDESVPRLAAMRQLKWLRLQGTRITPVGIAQLRERLPTAQIVSDFDRSLFSPATHDRSQLAVSMVAY